MRWMFASMRGPAPSLTASMVTGRGAPSPISISLGGSRESSAASFGKNSARASPSSATAVSKLGQPRS